MVANSRNNKKMDVIVQRSCSIESRGIFSENLLYTQNSLSDYNGVEVIDRNTEGVFSQVLHAKLNLGGVTDDGSLPAPASPPGSPVKWPCKMSLLSPVTPLELPGSPVQPMKKLRGPDFDPTHAVKVLMDAEQQRMFCA